jgi:hypothetical protein
VVEQLGLVGRLVLPQLCRLAIERALDVWIAEHALDGEQHGADVVRRRPLLFEDIEADVAILVDVGVVARRLKLDSGRSVRVVLGKRQRQLERQALVDLVLGGVGVSEGTVQHKTEVKSDGERHKRSSCSEVQGDNKRARVTKVLNVKNV